MKISVDTINKLQHDASCIRNICILAHVDHGKTTLSDSLLATNGIISQRMAGKVRYLDSREDEQTRGITMEASAISLYFKVMKVNNAGDKHQANGEKGVDSHDDGESHENKPEPKIKEHLINLIDSPGHIDFSSEVSTSSRLCDGAIVLVDAVEGVCSQTINVLRQCWIDNLKPLLVINKIDRLIIEWKMSPLEAYQHVSRIIEQVNSVIGSFYAGDRLEDDLNWREAGEIGEFVEKDDEHLYFTPEKNNVIFASAVDGWAFSINTFARIYLKKLGFSQAVLAKTLWGDFHLDMKNKKILPGKKIKSKQSKPLFISLILEPIWAVYQNCVIERDQEKLEKIIEKLQAKLSPRDLKSKDHKQVLNQIMTQWIPLSHAVLGAVIDYLPSPVIAQKEKTDKLLNESLYASIQSESELDTVAHSKIVQSMRDCDNSLADQQTVAYVSKLISVPNAELPKDTIPGSEATADELKERSRIARELAKRASEEAAAAQQDLQISTESDLYNVKASKDPFQWEFEEEDFEIGNAAANDEDDIATANDETLIGFTRVYSGALYKGQRITVVGPKYNPALSQDDPGNQSQLVHEVEIKDLFLIMGRELVRMEQVPAGNIVGVVGLDEALLKNGTLSSNIPLDQPYINLASTSTMIHNKPIMKIAVEPANPSKLAKLERGLDLLSKADPILEWYVDDESGELIVCVAGELHLERCLKDLEERFAKGCEVTVKEPVIPFRETLADDKINADSQELQDNGTDESLVEDDLVQLKFDVKPLPKSITSFLIQNEATISSMVRNRAAPGNTDNNKEVKRSFKENLINLFDEEKEEFNCDYMDSTQLVDNIISFGPKRIGPNIFIDGTHSFRHILETEVKEKFDYETQILGGVQLAMNEGPLAAEPLQGLAVVITKAQITTQLGEEKKFVNTGRIINQTKNLIHKEFLKKSPRLMLAMYTCEIQAATEVLGKVYAVVQKREGSIISEEMKEGTPFFTIVARVPVIQAFGFSEDIRKKTSGAASPQLVFDGFDMLDFDPFWVPQTEEELEELGEFAERENIARRYMNKIRRRKGLFVDEKVVNKAEKQRTLKKD